MKRLIIILLLATSLFGQWKTHDKWTNWINNSMPKPVAEWKWNHGITTVDTGTTVVKSLVSNWVSTNGLYDATQVADTARPVYDATNGWVVFDGADDYLITSNPINYTAYNEVTFAVWLYVNSLPSTDGVFIISEYNAGNYAQGFEIRNNGDLRWFTNNGTRTNVYKSGAIIPNTTYFIVGTLDKNGNRELYLNDIEVASDVVAPGNIINYDLYIGQVGINNYYFDGYISEICIFSHALSNSQIKHLYNKGRPQ